MSRSRACPVGFWYFGHSRRLDAAGLGGNPRSSEIFGTFTPKGWKMELADLPGTETLTLMAQQVLPEFR